MLRRLAAAVAVMLLTAPGAPAAAVTDPVAAGPRVYAIDAYNDMYLFPGDGHGHLGGGISVWPKGGLWRDFHGLAACDYNGDGWPDVAGIDANWDMSLYAGSTSGALTGRGLMWTGGGLWRGFRRITGGDFNGDGNCDVAGIDAYGQLNLYRGDGHGRLVGGGGMWPGQVWGGFTQLGTADLTGDGRPDLPAIDAYGNIQLYRGDGQGHAALGSGQQIWPTAWSGFRQLTGADFTGDGLDDLLAVDAGGNMRLYVGDGTGHVDTSTGQVIWGGGVWAGFHYVSAAAMPTPSLGDRTAYFPLGDSITFGYGSEGCDGNGYRGPLADHLNTVAPMGRAWMYEGALRSGSTWWSHEGRGGNTITDLTGYLPGALRAAPNGGLDVDVVLLHAGTNDAGRGRTGGQMLADMSTLLDRALSATPTVRVLVAQIAYAGTGAQVQAEQDFDAGLPAVATSKGPRVRVVDLRSVPRGPDGTHPDCVGYQQMADLWMTALTAAGWLP